MSKLCPFMSRAIGDNNYSVAELFEVYCRDDCVAKRKDGGCKLIDGKE